MSDKTHWSETDDPRRFQRGLFGSMTAWAIALCLLFGAIGVVGWQVGWWFKGQNVERQVELDNNNTGVQTAWRDEAVKTVAEFALVPEGNAAARGALRDKACDLIARLNEDYRTPKLVNFETKECM